MTDLQERTEPAAPTVTEFVCNGSTVRVGDHPHLLAALREELGLIAAKDGCSPSGQCGCCTVLLNGKARVACQIPLEKAQGAEIVTPEGLSDEERHRYAAAFGAAGAVQCGFCTPGILMRVKALIDNKGAGLTRDQASRHLGAHLCRCTGYLKILDAVDMLATGADGIGADGTAVEIVRGVGSRAARYESTDLALGDKLYIDDMTAPGMLHGAVHLAEHARADVISIDTSRAEAVPGVVASFTGADVPGDLRIGLIHKDWPVFIPEGGRTSYLGDIMALVVADSRETARRAAELVDVVYEPLPPITDPAAAVADGAEDAVWGLDGNILSVSTYARGGDVEDALASSAHVVRETFQTQRVEQAFLEPESTLAVPKVVDGERGLDLYTGGQGVWDDRDQTAAVLGIDSSRIWAEQVANGGAFGGKEDCANQTQTALAAWLLNRPVKTTFSREESLLVHPKRHPVRIELAVGCDAEGRLTALRARMLGDSGPYASVGMKVLERAAGHACGPYVVPVVDVEAVAARTNNSVCGRLPGLRRQPGPVRHGGRPGPPGRRGGHQRLGDPPAQRGVPRSRLGPGPDHGRRQPRCHGLPGGHQAGLRRGHRGRQGGRTRAGSQELRARQRFQGDQQGRGAFSWPTRPTRPGRRPDPTPSWKYVTAGPRWARACTPWPCRWRWRNSACGPTRSRCTSTPAGNWAPARPPARGER